MNVVAVDWRRYGDVSAVGQLTRKIFSERPGLRLRTVQVRDDGITAHLAERRPNGTLDDAFGRAVGHDALLLRLRRDPPGAFYVRLSPHKATLELACKLRAAMPAVPMVVHYMDRPSFAGMPAAREAYLRGMYRFLGMKADSLYVIHDSSLDWIAAEYGKPARVLANFVAKTPPATPLARRPDAPLRIVYLGSIDRKMNADTIAAVCREAAGKAWVELTIHSNSGLWGPTRDLAAAHDNIRLHASKLDDAAYAAEIARADLLLLPYNLDPRSTEFLQHSFSNKLIDYLEAGQAVLAIGDASIPTIQAARESGMALVVGSADELSRLLSSREALLGRLSNLRLDGASERIEALRRTGQSRLADFFDDLARLSARSDAARPPAGRGWEDGAVQRRQLGFAIRRKLYDLHGGERQSLSASLAVQLLRRNGYRGIDYEV